MASYDKRSRDSNTINLAFATQAQYLPAINETNLPKCTPYLLDLFRSHSLVGNGFELGEGLNPFSIICLGHPNTKDVLHVAERQATVEAGSTVSLSDATQFKTKDGRFPKSYIQATDKLWGLVLVTRVYLGDNHVLFIAFRDSVTAVVPMMQQLESLFSHNPRSGMLIAIKVLLFYQHILQNWLRKARITPVGTPLAADGAFDRVEEAMRMQSFDSLPRVPDHWMDVLKTQLPDVFQPAPPARIRGGGGDGSPAGGASGGSSSVVVNNHLDAAVKRRWAASGLTRSSDLKSTWAGSGEYCYPAIGGQQLCLNYHAVGKCKKGCRNAASHKSYGQDGVDAILAHLTACGH